MKDIFIIDSMEGIQLLYQGERDRHHWTKPYVDLLLKLSYFDHVEAQRVHLEHMAFSQ